MEVAINLFLYALFCMVFTGCILEEETEVLYRSEINVMSLVVKDDAVGVFCNDYICASLGTENLFNKKPFFLQNRRHEVVRYSKDTAIVVRNELMFYLERNENWSRETSWDSLVIRYKYMIDSYPEFGKLSISSSFNFEISDELQVQLRMKCSGDYKIIPDSSIFKDVLEREISKIDSLNTKLINPITPDQRSFIEVSKYKNGELSFRDTGYEFPRYYQALYSLMLDFEKYLECTD